MCKEFHCECCPDDLPQISCGCDDCYHGDDDVSLPERAHQETRLDEQEGYQPLLDTVNLVGVEKPSGLSRNGGEKRGQDSEVESCVCCHQDENNIETDVKTEPCCAASTCKEHVCRDKNSGLSTDVTLNHENCQVNGNDSAEIAISSSSALRPAESSENPSIVHTDMSCQEKRDPVGTPVSSDDVCCRSCRQIISNSPKSSLKDDVCCKSCNDEDTSSKRIIPEGNEMFSCSCEGSPSQPKVVSQERVVDSAVKCSCCDSSDPCSNSTRRRSEDNKESICCSSKKEEAEGVKPSCCGPQKKPCGSQGMTTSPKEEEKEDGKISTQTCDTLKTLASAACSQNENKEKKSPCCSSKKKPCGGIVKESSPCQDRKEKPCCSSQDEIVRQEQSPCCSSQKKTCDNTKASTSPCPEKKELNDVKKEPCCNQENECLLSQTYDDDVVVVETSPCRAKEETDYCPSKQQDCCADIEGQNSESSCDEDDSCCQGATAGETVLLLEPSDVSPIEVTEEATSEVKKPPPLIRRNTTKLRVQNICCAMEGQLVQDCLKPLEGIQNVAVNVIGRVVYVRHDPDVTSATELVETLNRVHLGATVMETGVQVEEDKQKVPLSIKLLFVYVFVQTVLLVTAIVGLFLEKNWHMWFAIAEIVFGVVPIVKEAFISAKNFRMDINVLMLIAIVGTLALSDWVEGATVVYVFAFAGALEEYCMFRVQRTISGLMLERPQVAVLVDTGECVSVELVAVGTLIAVRPGELIPLDGVVVKGRAAVDESSITGEALPVEKTVDSKVFSGTVDQNGYLEIKTTSDSSSSTVSKVAQMVQEAQTGSTKTEAIINRFAKYYTPLVVLTAALIVIFPAILGAAGVGTYLQDIQGWGRKALVLLVIACPCALVMSTPIAVVCSITAAARKGALVKGGEHLETLAKLQTLAFDKTGTLTEGKFQVMNMESAYGVNEREVLRLAAGLESKSSHPIAAAIVNEFSGCVAEMVKTNMFNLPEVNHFKMYEGQGISGLIEGNVVRVGNRDMLEKCKATLGKYMKDKYVLWSKESKTVVFVCVNEKVALMIALADAIRPNTSVALDWLRNLGVQTSMITGDNSRTAEAVRANLSLDDCVSEMKPDEKLKWIKTRQGKETNEGLTVIRTETPRSRICCSRKRDDHVIVGMVGDGVNDGPALAAADVGIAMGAGGTALAVEAADVALMSNNLAKIPELVTLARFCSRVVKQNITISVLLKLAIVIVALAGHVTLWMAVIADVFGLIFVILNGLRPLAWKAPQKYFKTNMDIELGFAKTARTSYVYESVV